MALGKNVEHLRKLAGLTRRAVARGIGIEEDQAIYALETRDSVRSEFAPALAKFFSVDLDALITQDITGLSQEEIRSLSIGRSGGDEVQSQSKVTLVHTDKLAGQSPTAPTEQIAELVRLFGLASPTGRNLILESARNAAETNVESTDGFARNKP